MQEAKSLREIAFDVTPQMANFVSLAEGQDVVSLIGKLFSTPEITGGGVGYSTD